MNPASLSRRSFLRALGAATATAAMATRAAARPQDRPNILLIVADDLGYAELGCQGNTDIPTPHIDAIAANGVRFTSGYVTDSYCCPSRAGMLTGRYQTRFGHELNAIGVENKQPGVGLPLTERTIADHLKAAGYTTGMFGKWHLGGSPPFHPLRRGFDTFYGFLHEGHFFLPPPYRGAISRFREREPEYDLENPMLRGDEPIVEERYLTHALTEEAIAFIEANKDRPFFCYLPYSAVHSPMQATLEDMERFEDLPNAHRAIFAGMLASIDDGVGQVLATLREHGIEDNTLVIFISDNGGPTAELTSNNAPYRGGKGQHYEGGVRIPFLLQWKARLPAGQVYEKNVSSLDILPTALAAANAESVSDFPLDGIDLLPYLDGTNDGVPHEELYWRRADWYAYRKGPWKIVHPPERWGGKLELYNIEEDLAEEHNLIDSHPEIAQELTAAWDTLNAEMIEPLWGTGGRMDSFHKSSPSE